MPTANMPSIYLLHNSELLEAPVFRFAPAVKQAESLEQRFRLLRVHLQRYMRSLHTFLLGNGVGSKERADIVMSNCSDSAGQCQVVPDKFHLAPDPFFCYIRRSFLRSVAEVAQR